MSVCKSLPVLTCSRHSPLGLDRPVVNMRDFQAIGETSVSPSLPLSQLQNRGEAKGQSIGGKKTKKKPRKTRSSLVFNFSLHCSFVFS